MTSPVDEPGAPQHAVGLQRMFLEALDPAVRGQAFALQLTGLMTLQGLGPLVTGAVAEAAPTWLAMAGAGIATMFVALLWRPARFSPK